MAKIFTIHNETSVPDWFVNQPSQPAKFAGSQADADRIATLPADLTDEGITSEMDAIEKCAATNAPYFYNASWNKDAIEKITEFAAVCNVKAISANPTDPLVQEAKTQTSEVIKTASVAARVQPVQPMTIADPFKLDSKGSMSHMKKATWQEPSSEAKAINPSIFQNSGAVIRMSGSEDPRVSSHLKAIPGQNSVTNPNALHDLAEQVDTGVRLRQEAKDRSEKRQAASREWETSFSQKMKEGGTAKTKVTAFDAGQGHGKAFGSMHLDAAPEKAVKTEGEQLGDRREARRKEIQRDNTDERAWDGLQETTKAKVSDLLLAGLEKGLNKIAASKQAVKTAKSGLQKEAFLPIGAVTGKCERCGKPVGKSNNQDVNLPPVHMTPQGMFDGVAEAACKPAAAAKPPMVNLPTSGKPAAAPAQAPMVNLPKSH